MQASSGFSAIWRSLDKPATFTACLRPLRGSPWVVYAKRPFGGPEQVLDYLGRYTHRVAIANSRLVALTDGRVSFLWKDYRHHDKPKVMTLDADEFIRRFLLHVLPDGFHRIRHYGYLANGHRLAKLARCRRAAGASRAGAACPCRRLPRAIPAAYRPFARAVPVLRRPHDRDRHHSACRHRRSTLEHLMIPPQDRSPPSFPQRPQPSMPLSCYCVLPLAPAGIRAVHSSQPRRSPEPILSRSAAIATESSPRLLAASTANRQRLGSSTKAAAKSP